MSSFLTLTLSPKALRRLNACRLYLQVITLADITDGGGHLLMDHYLKGHKAPDRRSKFDWPIQMRPDSSTWKFWECCIRRLFTRDMRHKPYLRQLLRAWTSRKPHQTWSNTIDNIAGIVHRPSADDTTMIHTPLRTRKKISGCH